MRLNRKSLFVSRNSNEYEWEKVCLGEMVHPSGGLDLVDWSCVLLRGTFQEIAEHVFTHLRRSISFIEPRVFSKLKRRGVRYELNSILSIV